MNPHRWYMKIRFNLAVWYKKLTIDPVLTSFVVFILASIVLLSCTFAFYSYDSDFRKNLLVEAHGMLFDILVIGCFILWLNKRGMMSRKIKRYKEEIDDFRHWKSEEAIHRIVGIIKRLNRHNVSKINLTDCSLIGADLAGANLSAANLSKTNLTGANLIKANLINANLSGAYLSRANLSGTDLAGADLSGAYLRYAYLSGADHAGDKQLDVNQLSVAKTLYRASLDEELLAEIKAKHPKLFEKPFGAK